MPATDNKPLDSTAIGADGEAAAAEANRRLFDYASRAQRDWNQAFTDNREYYGGAHWTEEQKQVLLSRGQKPVAIQATYQIVEQAVGMLTARRPSFRATARENTDAASASVWSDLFQWMWQQSRGATRLTQIVRDFYTGGMGWAYPYIDGDADFGKGEVLFRDLDPQIVLPDPRSTDPLLDDAAFVLVASEMTLERIEELFGPQAKARVKEGGERLYGQDGRYSATNARIHGETIHTWDIVDGFERPRYRILERFQRVRRRAYRVFNPATGKEEILSREEYAAFREEPAYVVTQNGLDLVVTDPASVAALDQTFDRFGPVLHERPAPAFVTPGGEIEQADPITVPGPASPGALPGTERLLTPTTVGSLIDEGTLPSAEFLRPRIRALASSGQAMVYQGVDLPTSYYPTVAFPNGHTRTPYPTGDVTRLRDLQDLINKSQSLILAWQATATNMKVFYPEGSLTDEKKVRQEWGKAGTAMIPYDPALNQITGSQAGGIVLVHPPPLPQGLFQNIDRSLALMERIAGIYALQQGDPGQQQSRQPFRGTLALDEFGQRRMKHKLDQIHASLERLGTIMKDYAQVTYTGRKVLRLVGPSGEQKTVELGSASAAMAEASTDALDITTGQYDIMVVAGSTLPSNRWGRLDTYLQLYDRQLVDDRAVLEQTEIPDAAAILERKSIYSQQQQAIEQLQQQVQQFQGQLQRQISENITGQKKIEVERFKRRLAAFESDIDKTVQVFRVKTSEATKRANQAAKADAELKAAEQQNQQPGETSPQAAEAA